MSDYHAPRRAASRAMYPRIRDNRTRAATYNPAAREGYTVRQSHGGGWVMESDSGAVVEYHDTLAEALASIQTMNVGRQACVS